MVVQKDAVACEPVDNRRLEPIVHRYAKIVEAGVVDDDHKNVGLLLPTPWLAGTRGVRGIAGG